MSDLDGLTRAELRGAWLTLACSVIPDLARSLREIPNDGGGEEARIRQWAERWHLPDWGCDVATTTRQMWAFFPETQQEQRFYATSLTNCPSALHFDFAISRPYLASGSLEQFRESCHAALTTRIDDFAATHNLRERPLMPPADNRAWMCLALRILVRASRHEVLAKVYPRQRPAWGGIYKNMLRCAKLLGGIKMPGRGRPKKNV